MPASFFYTRAVLVARRLTHYRASSPFLKVHLNGTDMCCRTPAETTHPASSTAKAVLTAQRATATRLIGEGEPPIAPIQSRRWIQLSSSAAHRQAARLRVLHWRWQPGTQWASATREPQSLRLSGTVIVRGWQDLALTECGTVPTAGPAAFGLSLRLRLGVRVRAGPAAWHATRDGPRASAPPATVCPPGLHQA